MIIDSIIAGVSAGLAVASAVIVILLLAVAFMLFMRLINWTIEKFFDGME